jgi:hypothetical protein
LLESCGVVLPWNIHLKLRPCGRVAVRIAPIGKKSRQTSCGTPVNLSAKYAVAILTPNDRLWPTYPGAQRSQKRPEQSLVGRVPHDTTVPQERPTVKARGLTLASSL